MNPQAPFCVDYNRSFAPYMKKIKQAIERRHSPLMVHYRMNAGYIQKIIGFKLKSAQEELLAKRAISLICFVF